MSNPFHFLVTALVLAAISSHAASEDREAAPPLKTGHPLWWDGAFHPVIWDDNYKLGMGLSGGVRTKLPNQVESGVELLVTHFNVRLEGLQLNQVNEIGLRTFAIYPIRLEAPFTVKLGGYLGWHRLEKGHNYISFGGESQAAFTFNSPWGLYVQFSPGYLMGKNSQGIFRLGLGTTYAFGVNHAPLRASQPKPQAAVAPEPAANEAAPATDFKDTMVHLPEP